MLTQMSVRGNLLHHRRLSRSPNNSGVSAKPSVGRRRSTLQIILFLVCPGFFVVYFFSRRRSICSTRTETSSSIVATSIPKQVKNGNEKPFQVVVLTHNRRESLLRLLRSLREAEYEGATVDLRIWVDRTPSERQYWRSMFDSIFVSTEDRVDKELVNEAARFNWPHGEKTVHVWDRHVGIWGQWIDSYKPNEDDRSQFGVILEDDLQVSVWYYKWLKGAKQRYGHRQDVFGYTLQRGTLRAKQFGFGRRAIKVARSEPAYFYLLLGSWGYAPEAAPWARFREWFHERSCDREYHPYVEGLVPTKWYKKQEKKRSMWTMWHIKYADIMGLYTVYANLDKERTLAANWREPGLHFRISPKKKRASARTKQIDFKLLERGDVGEEAGTFSYPWDTRKLDWNGTYIDRSGNRSIH